jgi:hypothetical protein
VLLIGVEAAQREKRGGDGAQSILKRHNGGAEKRRGWGGGRGTTSAVPRDGAWRGARHSVGGGSQSAVARPRRQWMGGTCACAAVRDRADGDANRWA